MLNELYAQRREFFIKEFNKLLSDIHPSDSRRRTELHRLAPTRSRFRESRACPRRDRNQTITAIIYCIQAKLSPAFVFGFAAWTPAQIRESLLRLACALR